MIYPWQQNIWQHLINSALSQRLPHALLLTGMAGLGKRDFAETLARGLLCTKHQIAIHHQNHHDCRCHSCLLILGRTHPNVYWIEPEKEGHPIKVDAIREGCDFVMQTSAASGFRFLIIYPANKMNLNAANALLKTLEEPPRDAVLILISDQDAYLPATIVSRCQRVIFSKPSKQLAVTWLQNQTKKEGQDWSLLLALTNGSPLAALALAENDSWASRPILFNNLQSFAMKQGNPIQAAQQLQDLDLITFLDWMTSCIMDVMRAQVGAQAFLNNHDQTETIIMLAKQTQLSVMNQMLSNLNFYRDQLLRGINLNKNLLMEHIFIRFMESTT